MLKHASALRSRLSPSVHGSGAQKTPGSLIVATSFDHPSMACIWNGSRRPTEAGVANDNESAHDESRCVRSGNTRQPSRKRTGER